MEVKSQLDSFIKNLAEICGVHILINTQPEYPDIDELSLSAERRVHSSDFCRAAKANQKAFCLCIENKTEANKRAEEGKSFIKTCPFGLTSVVHPVKYRSNIIAIIYVSNICRDKKKTEEKIASVCLKIGINDKRIISELGKIKVQSSTDSFLALAASIESFMTMIIESKEKNKSYSTYHSAVAYALSAADAGLDQPFGLSEIAEKFAMNPKYLGRLFAHQVGKSFNTFLKEKRIERAKLYLSGSSIPIIEIAFLVGMNNVTYFNKIFKESVGLTPTEYRKLKQRE